MAHNHGFSSWVLIRGLHPGFWGGAWRLFHERPVALSWSVDGGDSANDAAYLAGGYAKDRPPVAKCNAANTTRRIQRIFRPSFPFKSIQLMVRCAVPRRQTLYANTAAPQHRRTQTPDHPGTGSSRHRTIQAPDHPGTVPRQNGLMPIRFRPAVFCCENNTLGDVDRWEKTTPCQNSVKTRASCAPHRPQNTCSSRNV